MNRGAFARDLEEGSWRGCLFHGGPWIAQNIGFFLYRDFTSQTESIKLRARLDPLEAAIYERMQELGSGSHAEKLAIQVACEKNLEIKINKLGFLAVHSERGRSARIG
jgi:hypothetical protein